MLICTFLLLSSQAALAQFSQDGPKLIGGLAVGDASQGWSVALSEDGATAIVGGPYDNGGLGGNGSGVGAVSIFSRGNNGVWTQQSGKLVGTGAVGPGAQQGYSVALSADGNTAVVGGPFDNQVAFGTAGIEAAWVFNRGKNGVWTQQGGKAGRHRRC